MNNLQITSAKLNKSKIKKIIPIFIFIVALATMLIGVGFWENSHYKIDSSDDTEESDGVIRYQDKWYINNDKLENILFIGIDKKQNNVDSENSQNDQQADFLLLATIDKQNKTVSALQINRDTMVDVNVRSISGESVGTKNMQIALSHTYGSGGNDSCINTVKAAQNLLYGIKIDHYVALTMDGVQILNDSLGGIKVTIEDDFSKIDKSLVKGTEVTLKGEQALTFIRSRGGMEDSTNINRMERQKTYISALYTKVKEIVDSENDEILYDIFTKLSDTLTTDYSINQINYAIEKYADYDFSGFDSISGNVDDSKEFIEFYADDVKLKDYVINTFFVEQTQAED